ncbi:MAG: hypothetical protein WEB04_06510 [Dehalococcoidia bacterium]
MNAGEWIDLTVAAVTAATLLVVLWYTWETRRQASASARMADAMSEQTRSADRATLLIEIPRLDTTEFMEFAVDSEAEPDPHAGYPESLTFRVSNVGRGPAKFLGASIRHPNARYKAANKDVLRQGDTWDVRIALHSHGVMLIADSLAESSPKGLRDFLMRIGAPPSPPGYDCGIAVTYADAQDKTYVTYMQFGMIAVTDCVRKVVESRLIMSADQRTIALQATT